MCSSTRPRSADAPAEWLIDAHCHIDAARFDNDRDQLLTECMASGVRKIVVPGTVPESWVTILELARCHAMLAPAVGLHPWWADRVDEDSMARLDQLLAANREIVAVGECGLDRRRGPALECQQSVFEAQVELAETHSRPLLIHSVGTHDTVLSLLRRKEFTPPVLIHGFSGSREQAQALVQQGAFIGVSGVITYPRARKTQRAIAAVPLDALVLETDAPGMPPRGVPKDTNSPLNLRRVLDDLCTLREEPRAVVVRALWRNTQRLFMGQLDTEGLQEGGAPV